MFIALAMRGLPYVTIAVLCSAEVTRTVTSSFVRSWTISVNVNEGIQDHES
jgi:hypothetical protein